MNGRLTFEKTELKFLLEQEFLIHTDSFEDTEYTKAQNALFDYENMDEFFKVTGWARDNPECRTENYLTSNRICRWWNGRLVYFSRIMWEDEDEIGSE